MIKNNKTTGKYALSTASSYRAWPFLPMDELPRAQFPPPGSFPLSLSANELDTLWF